MRYHYGRPNVCDFAGILGRYPSAEFAKITRSTVPLLFYWSEQARVDNLFNDLSVPLETDLIVHCEFQVDSFQGETPSYTDIMYRSTQTAIGVEGKSTEPMYETVGVWLARANARSRKPQVLQHWIQLIEGTTGQVDRGLVNQVVYQMLHRTASVCSMPVQRKVMVYQLFGIAADPHDYRQELGTLVAAVHPAGGLEIWQHRVWLNPSPAYVTATQAMQLIPDEDVEERAIIVRAALQDETLFGVHDSQIEQIG